ncbi:MAG: 16S rRNA (uracil(1498)-N(3))-methyltransferase [Pseudomonadota bacterium]
MGAVIRLHVKQPLSAGQMVHLEKGQAHYLFHVMRLRVGDTVLIFDGASGEWRAEVNEIGKRTGSLLCREQTKPLLMPPDVWVLFAPIKKARTDFIVEKAAEMGARRIVPVITAFTNAARIQRDRLQAHVIEAVEQCGGTFVPEVTEAAKFNALFPTFERGRQIMFCDETKLGEPVDDLDRDLKSSPWAIMIGPEGGFSEDERRRLTHLPQAHPVSLGPRVLRADTAVVAAMALWQRHFGDWR